jgi:transcriptional regulator with XRE-family HTH domain
MEGMFGRVGQALALVRQERGISQYELADRCRIGRSQISKYEAGRELMKLETLAKILNVLAIEPDQFFRLAGSLTDSLKPVPEAEREIRQRKLQEAFVRLHAAIDHLQEVIEASQSNQPTEVSSGGADTPM